MTTNVIRYKEAIDLGFKREDQMDSVFFDTYGYQWFTMQLKLAKTIYLDWDCTERTVELIRYKPKDGNVLGRMPLFSIEEIKEIIEFFKKK